MATSWNGGTVPVSVVSSASVDHISTAVAPIAVARRVTARSADIVMARYEGGRDDENAAGESGAGDGPQPKKRFRRFSSYCWW